MTIATRRFIHQTPEPACYSLFAIGYPLSHGGAPL
jgi:hypothetical protein